VSCAAALATIDVLEEGGLWARAGVVGHQMLSQLREATHGNRAVVEVRGIGLMIGIELVSGEVAAEVQRRCFDAGALVLVCGTDDQVIRLIPPLTISDDEAARGIEILTAALGEVAP
jgi:4-aminobutyrate aminotransferase-like enzyme